jgi:hypothetical protein
MEMKKSVGDFLSEMPYQYYYCDSAADRLLNKLKRPSGINCRDVAPHEKEIEKLQKLGLTNEQIREIIEKKYYQNIVGDDDG